MNIGVLAFQGSVREHIKILSKLGVNPIPVKRVKELERVSALILPGGESTTIGKLLRESGLKEAIIERAKEGMPIWGTCAGMILLAKYIVNQEYTHLGLMDIWVRRNAYGSQINSFIRKVSIPFISDEPLELVFIRAPYVERVGEGVEVLLELDGKIVAVKQENLLATSFHPEVTDNPSFHKYFLSLIKN